MDRPNVEHIPVLADQLADLIKLPPDAVVVDATVGQGGHSRLFGQALDSSGLLICMDVDDKSLRVAADRLGNLACRVVTINANFAGMDEQLSRLDVEKVDFILADLGWSSVQVADESFGLSFNTDMPLDMRIDRRLKTTAADIVNTENEKELADIIYRFGEDRASRRIARFIVMHRRREKIVTTGQLAALVSRALARPGMKHRRIHPATRTFQALRVAVNHELENLEKLLSTAPRLLKEGGRVAIISFHSLEDRLVKWSFRHYFREGIYRWITPKVITPTRLEALANRRARSAKLRIAVRSDAHP